jgi:endonuclease I
MASIKKHFEISGGWTGSAYCGLEIDWDYKHRTFDLAMLGYIKATLHNYQHTAPARTEHAKHTWNPPVYGANTQ